MLFDGNILNSNKGPEGWILKGKIDRHPYRDKLDRKSQLDKYLSYCTCFYLSSSQKVLRGLS